MGGQLRASKWDYDEPDDNGDEERALAARERLFDAPTAPVATAAPVTAKPETVTAAQPHRPAPRSPRPKATAAAGGRTKAAGTKASAPVEPAAKSTVEPPAQSLSSQLPNVNIPTPTLRPSRGDGTGFAFGLILYAIGLNYFHYGWPGVTGWVNAKFFNRTMTEGKP